MPWDSTQQAADARDYVRLCEHLKRNYAILWGMLYIEMPMLKVRFGEPEQSPRPPRITATKA